MRRQLAGSANQKFGAENRKGLSFEKELRISEMGTYSTLLPLLTCSSLLLHPTSHARARLVSRPHSPSSSSSFSAARFSVLYQLGAKA